MYNTGKTTRLLPEVITRAAPDRTGWYGIAAVVLFGLLCLAVQAGYAYATRPRFTPLEARPLSAKSEPITIFRNVIVVQTVVVQPTAQPTSVPTPEPTPAEAPTLGNVAAQAQAPAAEVAPAPVAQDGGVAVAPDGCEFPIVNGTCGGGNPAPAESDKGSRPGRRLPPK